MSRTILYGNGTVASLAWFYLEHDSDHDVAAFCVDREFIGEPSLHGLPVVPLEELTDRYPPNEYRAFVAMGFGNLNRDREERFDQLRGLGYSFISYVNSSTSLSLDASIGDNAFVMEGCIIQPFVTIGDNVTMGPGTTVGHHVAIGDHCFFASRADVSGHVTIDDRCFIGANSTIRNAVRVGHDCVIGAGAVIMADTQPSEVHASARARLMPLPSDKLPRI